MLSPRGCCGLLLITHMPNRIGRSIRVVRIVLVIWAVASCSSRAERVDTRDSTGSDAAPPPEHVSAPLTDSELLAFMSTAFHDLAIEGLEMARRSRNSEPRKLGKGVSREFAPLAACSDSLARQLRLTAHRERKSGSSGAKVQGTPRDIQLVRHLETSRIVAEANLQLQHQAEEMEAQTEELTSQAEELHRMNVELTEARDAAAAASNAKSESRR